MNTMSKSEVVGVELKDFRGGYEFGGKILMRLKTEQVKSWSVIGTKVYRDEVLFAKCANWPDAIAIRDALACHNDLLEACKVAFANLEHHYSSEHLVIKKLRAALDKATPHTNPVFQRIIPYTSQQFL